MNSAPDQPTVPLVVIQRNPHSGSGRGRGELRILTRELRRAGICVRMFSDREKLDAYVAQVPPSRQLKCIVAAGGDGTVANLVNRHPGVPLAILPLGTENLLACYLGLRRCGRTLAKTIQRGQVRVLDSATANGLRFLLMLSVGVDAEIVESVHSARKGNIRRLGYVWPSLKAFFRSQPKNYIASATDGSAEISGSHVIITNVPRYGFGLPFAPGSLPDDNLLDVRAFHGKTRWQIFWHAIKLKLGLPLRKDEISRFCTPSVSIRCEDSEICAASQCDGDPGPSLPILIQIEHQSLTLIT